MLRDNHVIDQAIPRDSNATVAQCGMWQCIATDDITGFPLDLNDLIRCDGDV